MPKFRKKPVVIEAEKVAFLLDAARNRWSDLPWWVQDLYESGNIVFGRDAIYIKTLEGDMEGKPTDMLIRGVRNELYLCKWEIFKETYEQEVTHHHGPGETAVWEQIE